MNLIESSAQLYNFNNKFLWKKNKLFFTIINFSSCCEDEKKNFFGEGWEGIDASWFNCTYTQHEISHWLSSKLSAKKVKLLWLALSLSFFFVCLLLATSPIHTGWMRAKTYTSLMANMAKRKKSHKRVPWEIQQFFAKVKLIVLS